MSVSWLERANAALREETHLQWRDWTRYLDAHDALLDGRLAEQQVAFERDDALEQKVGAARSFLALLPQERHTLFDQIRNERSQAVQRALEAERQDGTLVNLDAVERQSLAALREEALGSASEGIGVVPMREGDHVTWLEVDTTALRAAPTAALYALGEGESGGMRRRFILAGLLAAAGVLFCLVWFLWPRGAGGATEQPAAPAAANGSLLVPWPILAARVERAGGTVVTLSVTTDGATPAPDSAIWRREHLVPLRLCLPADVLVDASRLTLRSGEGRPDRVYTLAAPAQSSPDLLLEPCDGDAPMRTATLQQLIVAPDAALGEEQALAGGETVTLTELDVVGPGDDPTLPPAQARVTLQVRASLDDWAAYAPTLLLADGQALLPSGAPVISGEEVTLTYLVPLPTVDASVAWSLTPPGGQPPLRWRATLPAPPDRAAVVRAALDVTTVELMERDDQLQLRITVRNARDLPFQLTPDELRLTRGAAGEAIRLTAAEPNALAPLAPGATRTLTLAAPLRGDRDDTLILSVGIHRFRITWGD